MTEITVDSPERRTTSPIKIKRVTIEYENGVEMFYPEMFVDKKGPTEVMGVYIWAWDGGDAIDVYRGAVATKKVFDTFILPSLKTYWRSSP